MTLRRPPRKPRAIRVEDDLWNAAMHKAEERGEILSEVIREALKRYVKEGAIMREHGKAVDRVEFCWFGRGNRSAWPTEEEARRDAVEMKQDGARIQKRRVLITEWEDVADG